MPGVCVPFDLLDTVTLSRNDTCIHDRLSVREESSVIVNEGRMKACEAGGGVGRYPNLHDPNQADPATPKAPASKGQVVGTTRTTSKQENVYTVVTHWDKSKFTLRQTTWEALMGRTTLTKDLKHLPTSIMH